MSASRVVWVIRHLAFEDLGSLSILFAERGLAVRYLEAGVDSLAGLSQAGQGDLLVVLGGPIGVYETAAYPWLAEEIEVVGDWLRQGRATLGICLGAQLMAAALGAKVYPGYGKEIGWAPLALTEAGKASPVRHLAGELTDMLHWHGDTFDLPDGATLLASSALYPNQVYAWGEKALAFQCHPEFDHARVEQWLIGHAGELNAIKMDLQSLRQQSHAMGERLTQQARACLAEWLDTELA
ncbi:GMP synthase (glutamine-hydrolysing) [Formivibrio citricus]|uniref:GMP synthase (Glutamine-hydrolysing) n=1 Tax=Formivibrio citricus TaxID=83765 RepID=A0A1I4WCF5_9NEIS|nr:glutamine amidotransferase [Formivibrio citricus]SFN11105.1 GMP synthase (glutamine-hydrolysing) [Formivibrio citricus]